MLTKQTKNKRWFRNVGLALATSLTLGAASAASLNLNFDGLDPLANGFHYEGWLIVNDAPVSTGKFNVDANGFVVDLDGNAIETFDVMADVSGASKVVVSIEPAGDVDDIPAATKILAGDLVDGAATLSVDALLGDFMSVSGKYILATPTDGDGTDEFSGVWFLDITDSGPSAGLNLPELPAGWVYEGWAVIDGQPISTGRFTNLAAADDFSDFSGPLAGPPFPGEDFLIRAPEGVSFPTDLRGQTIVISIEPDADDSAAPFTLKPLVAEVPADAADHATLELSSNPDSFPKATATLQ